MSDHSACPSNCPGCPDGPQDPPVDPVGPQDGPQDVTPTKEQWIELTRKLFDALNITNVLYNRYVDNILGASKGYLAMVLVFGNFDGALKQSIIEHYMYEVFSQGYTFEEMTQLVDWFNSPLGQKFVGTYKDELMVHDIGLFTVLDEAIRARLRDLSVARSAALTFQAAFEQLTAVLLSKK